MPSSRQQTVSIDGHRLRVSNLDKVFYPATGTTKAEVIAYYTEIAPVMLPHTAGRPATRKRWPDGVGTADAPGQMFFQKDIGQGVPEWVTRGEVEHSDGPKTYPLVNDRATLAWLAQVAALEVHVPQWRLGSDGAPRNPDRLVLDLDPGEGTWLPECVAVAQLARTILGGMGLEPVPVTSGSKGIHLYTHLDGSYTSQQVSDLAHELARALEADHPDLVVSDMKKSLRHGKVLVDWSQNSASKTTVAPYSLRGRERPTVAVPRTWEELDEPGLRHLEYPEVLDLVARRGDPMAALGRQAGGGQDAGAVRDRLEVYRAKRDPSRTPEPVPEDLPPATADQVFVIQEHHARRLHYDLRLSHEGVLASWALPKGVPVTKERNNLAVQTEDHPMEYLTFHGTIPEGEYGAGEMTVWDTGTYELEKWREGKEVIVTLTGKPDGGLAGPDGPGRTSRFALIRTGERDGKNQWLIHLMDPPGRARSDARGRRTADRRRTVAGVAGGDDDAGPVADTTDAAGPGDEAGDDYDADPGDEADVGDPGDEADAGGPVDKTDVAGPAADGPGPAADGTEVPGTAADVAGAVGSAVRGPAVDDVPRPMLATPGDVGDLHDPEAWALEMKWDGIRAIVVVEGDQVRLLSRNGNDVTATYPDLADVPACVDAPTAVLDGEIVAFDEHGRPSFGVLQRRMNLQRARDIEALAEEVPVHLMLFDLLQVDGADWTGQTYDRRREALRLVVDPGRSERVELPPAFDGDVQAAVAASRRWHLEGVVAKRRDSRYAAGRRSRAWVKIKHLRAVEAVVIGWRPGQGSRAGQVGSLLLAVPDDEGTLRYVGRVGTGFTEQETRAWVQELGPIERRTPPVDDVPRADARDARWVAPRRVAEVELSEWTSTGRLRHPRWRGWRPDKDLRDVEPLSLA